MFDIEVVPSRSPDHVVPEYDFGMTTTKRKVSLSLDEELIAELESDAEGLSSQVNDAVRAEVERRRRHRALEMLLAHLDESEGPLDTDTDEAEIARFMRLLGGVA